MADIKKIRHDAYIQGFVAGKSPQNAADTIKACELAEQDYLQYQQLAPELDQQMNEWVLRFAGLMREIPHRTNCNRSLHDHHVCTCDVGDLLGAVFKYVTEDIIGPGAAEQNTGN